MQKLWSRRLSDVLLLILLLSLFSGCAAPGKFPGKNWETFLYDATRGNISTDAVEFPLEKAWQRSLSPFEPLKIYPEEQISSPAISEGVIFLGSADGSFYSFDLSTGAVLWKFNAREPIESSPTISGTKVFFGTAGGVLRCLDVETGKEVFRVETRSEIISSPLVAGGRVFTYSSDDRIHAVDAGSGERLWSYARTGFKAVRPRVFSSPASSEDGSSVYQVFSDGHLLSLKADTGRVLWEKKVIEDFSSSGARKTPLVSGNSVFVIDGSKRILELDGGTGDLKRTHDFTEASDFIVPDEPTLIAAGGSSVISFDRLKGALIWKTDVKGSVRSIFASSGHLFVITAYKKVPFGIESLAREKGFITALSREDGRVAWEQDLDSTVTAGAGTSGGRVVLFTDSGRVIVLGKGE